MSEKRKKVEAHIHKVIKTMDPSGYNTEKYKSIFAGLSDKQFDDWMKRMKDGKSKIYIYAPPMMKEPLSTENMLEAGKITKSVFFEKIRYYDEKLKRWVTPPKPYLILQLPIRRLKQFLKDKTGFPEGDSKISPLTGQVTGADKGSGMSQIEALSLEAKGLGTLTAEFMNLRGGNLEAYTRAIEDIGSGQPCTMEHVTETVPTSVHTLQAYLRGMHLENNLTDETAQKADIAQFL